MTRDFRLLAAGQGFSWLGNAFQTVALAVAVITTGDGARDLGLVMATNILTLLAGTLFGGIWADRLQPQRVMVASDAIRFAATAGIAAMFATGGYHLTLLCVLTVVSAGAGSFFNPAMSALKPLLVPAEDRQKANATLSLLQSMCGVAGPATAGITVAVFGAPAGFAINAVSFLASLAAVAMIRVRAPRGPRASAIHELRSGWREISSRSWLFSNLMGASVYHVANGVILVLVQIVAFERLGGAHAIGWIAAAEGLGGVIGSAIGIRLRPRRLLFAGLLALPLMSVWAFAYVWPGTLAAIMIGAVIGYAGLLFYDVAWDTSLQENVPHRALGRVSSWDYMTSFVAMPIGNALAGPLSDRFGIDRVLTVCGCVLLVASTAMLLVPASRRLTRTGQPAPDPLSPHTDPLPAAVMPVDPMPDPVTAKSG
ncbi:MFS transporter [Actinoplanes derwentensis]|uniref:Predicted arabinose efflux permease, MFS family n=1 Tax=Actinoplanes derwentensis TaxID=113562 RepID=A0A1H2C1K6_9ACTN|nr:MFS transporter [Actinoplanes derwentensis]GID84702.1 MFS transporter [Actinoplanes derwentensis]SDT64408.1 Predicted arabinose efflux permease, MFS family [Actinoplanes derwentensis]